jgi:hypothetical protein
MTHKRVLILPTPDSTPLVCPTCHDKRVVEVQVMISFLDGRPINLPSSARPATAIRTRSGCISVSKRLGATMPEKRKHGYDDVRLWQLPRHRDAIVG